MNRAFDELEEQRRKLQEQLDAQRSLADRNRLGQFSTPPCLAHDLLKYAESLLPKGETIRFLDPAIGTGVFYSALRGVAPLSRIERALGFEIDSHYGVPAAQLWKKTGLELRLTDFTKTGANERFNLLIANPPYVRHHHLTNSEKSELQIRSFKSSGARLSGLAGLYCHFVCLSHTWLSEGAISAWLIPSEFMDVNYGRELKRYFLERVTLLRIHRFDPNDLQFADALVSSAIVFFRNEPPPKGHSVTFSFGGSLLEPCISKSVPGKVLAIEKKWTRFPVGEMREQKLVPTISDFFKIKRGLATGDNVFFILCEEDLIRRNLPRECFRPILPSPRHITIDEIDSDENGFPILDRRLFLLDPGVGEGEIKMRFPSLWAYLEEGRAKGLHERYLCRHRAPWYAQENRPAPPIVCTYIGRSDTKRGKPFRFILNHSKATVANVYLAMYPKPELADALETNRSLLREIWSILNNITPEQLLGEGRVYGGGLHKLEPKELGNVPVPTIESLLGNRYRTNRQTELLLEEEASSR